MKVPVSVLAVFVCLAFTGCALFQEKVTAPKEGPAAEQEKREGEAREEAVKLYQYQGLRDELIVEPPALSTNMVKPGGKLSQELRITLLSPQKGKRFKVLEVTTLIGKGIDLKLARRESERPQGIYTSTLQVLIPRDLPAGDYTLVTIVATEEQQYRKTGTFRVLPR